MISSQTGGKFSVLPDETAYKRTVFSDYAQSVRHPEEKIPDKAALLRLRSDLPVLRLLFSVFSVFYNAGQGGELQTSHIFFRFSLSKTAEQNFTVICPA